MPTHIQFVPSLPTKLGAYVLITNAVENLGERAVLIGAFEGREEGR